MKLLLGILLFQCSLSVSAQNDVIRQWSYDINTEEGAPCSYDVSSNRLLLSGFDVTDDGFIYLAGGTPLRLACFDGSKVVFKKKVDEINSSSVFLKVRGDSVYLWNNEHASLVRVHKSGEGPVDRVPLLMSENQSATRTAFVPTDCYLGDNDIVLLKRRNTIIVNDSYIFPGFDIIHIDYDGRFIKWKWFGDNESIVGNSIFNNDILYQYLYPTKNYDKNDFSGHYKGEWNGYSIYWGNTYSLNKAAWTIVFASRDGVKSYDIPYQGTDAYGVIPMPVLTHQIDEETIYTAPSYCILRGNYLYLLGYRGEKRQVVVSRIDLQKSIEKI